MVVVGIRGVGLAASFGAEGGGGDSGMVGKLALGGADSGEGDFGGVAEGASGEFVGS